MALHMSIMVATVCFMLVHDKDQGVLLGGRYYLYFILVVTTNFQALPAS